MTQFLDQGALPFARRWELGPPTDPEPPPCAHETHSRHSAQQMTAIRTGLGEIADQVSSSEQMLASISETATRIEAAVKARSFLDDEVRRLRNAEHRDDFLAPVFRAIIEILDRMAEEELQIRQFENRISKAADALTREAISWVRDARTSGKTDLRNLLALFGIERFAPQPGEPFDPNRHRFLDYECHADPKLHGCIQGTRRHGYVRRYDNWVVRPAFVVVFKVTN